MRPVRPQAEKANGLLNFNCLALVLPEILGGGPKFTLGGPTPPGRPLAEKFFTQSEYFTIFNCVFNFNILALVVTEILGGPKFTLGGPVPPSTPIAEFFLYHRRVRYYVKWHF